jgi:hypothetical protein
VIRRPLEAAELGLFEDLDSGDILFIDNSHRVFQNSDVTVFFLDVLPRLKSGVVVHIHDIFWPFDYPTAWRDRYYSEQYLLGVMLTAGAASVDVMFPAAHIDKHAGLWKLVMAEWGSDRFCRIFDRNRGFTGGYSGTSFWFAAP